MYCTRDSIVREIDFHTPKGSKAISHKEVGQRLESGGGSLDRDLATNQASPTLESRRLPPSKWIRRVE